jgi:hypothetical protein
MLVYNIKRSINILGVSDLIAKLKNGTHYKATACFVFITNYFRLSKDSITNQLHLLPKKRVERLYCRLGVCILLNYQKKVFTA